MSFVRCIILLFLTSALFESCKKEDELPIKVIFGSPDDAMVFNLKTFDPEIGSKSVQISQPLLGTARLVVNNTFIIYEPGNNFEHDNVIVSVDGREYAEVVFFSKDLSSDCNPFARSYKFTVKKNAELTTFPGFVDFCTYDDRKNIYLSATDISPINGIGVGIGSGLITFFILPEPDFVGTQELIYEVGAAPISFRGEIYETDYLLSGLIQLTVIE
ncbi:MAG: hypothetical protein R2820_07880 [Cyclobacteriaceae bacterium]|nr:hypothetical protein [Cyclobacteriaceae bacterium]